MDELSLIKLLLGSVSMLCVLRLFIVAFLGDGQAGPAIGRLLRGLEAPPETEAKRQKGVRERRGWPH